MFERESGPKDGWRRRRRRRKRITLPGAP